MEFRQLGGSGFKVPALCLGTGTFGGNKNEFFSAWGVTEVEEATKLVDISLEAGLTMFDSADVYSNGSADEHVYRVVDTIDEVAKETGKTVPQIAINWLLQRPTVATVIIGARNADQLRQNLDAVGWKLTPAHLAKLDASSATTPIYPYWHQRGFTERIPSPV